jgi:hypothetical protein
LQKREQTQANNELVEAVVDQLGRLGVRCLPADPVQLSNHPVGVEEKRDEVVQLLEQRCMVLMHGMGGIGKTTVAKAVYTHFVDTRTDLPCHRVFLQPVMTDGDIVREQRRLIQQLFPQVASDPHPPQDPVGYRALMAKDPRLRGKPVMLAVDNVWGDALQRLLPLDIMSGILAPGSMLLVTSREGGALTGFQPPPAGSKHTLDMQMLDQPAALQLFRLHAFDGQAAPSHLEKIMLKVVDACKGLPMAVEVVAGHLGKKLEARVWRKWRDEMAWAYNNAPTEGRTGEARVLFRAYDLSFDALDFAQRKALVVVALALRGQPWEAVCAAFNHNDLDFLAAKSLLKRVDNASSGFLADLHDSVVEYVKSAGPGSSGAAIYRMFGKLLADLESKAFSLEVGARLVRSTSYWCDLLSSACMCRLFLSCWVDADCNAQTQDALNRCTACRPARW